MVLPPETPASWTWIPWGGGGEWWNRTRYLGSRPFSGADDLPQYWELENPEPYNSIGLILENGRRWIVRADGFVTRKTTEVVEPMIGKKTIGLLWDPAARTVSLFEDDSFRGVLWDNAPPLFLPMINPWPQGGNPGGRRTQAGFTGLVKLCLDRVADTIGGDGEIRDLPLPALFLGKLGRIQRGGRNLACHTKRSGRKRRRFDAGM